MGLECCFLALEAGLKAYTKCGFKVLEHVQRDYSQWGVKEGQGVYFLERVARK